MSLSKPLLNVLGSYLQNLYLHPIRTKSLTSCVIAASANLSSQLVSGERRINIDSIIAFAAFGLFFGGTLPHYFFDALERVFPAREIRFGVLRQLLIERLCYTPLFQSFSIYVVSRFEGKNHKEAFAFMQNIIKDVLHANWTWLTIFQVINLTVIPPVLRVLFINIVGFFWVMFVAKKRRAAAAAKSSKKIN
ncbi:peroxisomal membrane protein 2 [Arctopsyche grandis]|uniref:peroxisomal membrane protein 2 n=1 Tax=Arctopsyche grandis TaxID=121162 RepID=UPI00406D825B